MFQDDVPRLSEDLDSVRYGNSRMKESAESKLLDFNKDKSCMVIIGNRKFKKIINQQLDTNPIIFCNNLMRVSESEKYLGDNISSSLSESVLNTIQKRKGLCLKVISEIKLTVEDCRSHVVGGLLAGMDIWTMAVIPYLFANGECWAEMPKKAIALLNSIQNTFFRALFATCTGCPIPAFYWDTGVLLAENLVMLKKLLFYHYLSVLPEDSLAKEIYNLQKEN